MQVTPWGYTENQKVCFKEIFDVFDVNNDSLIGLNEFMNAYKAFGYQVLHDNNVLIKNFTKISPKGNHVPVIGVVDDWVTFTTSNNTLIQNFVIEDFEEAIKAVSIA